VEFSYSLKIYTTVKTGLNLRLLHPEGSP